MTKDERTEFERVLSYANHVRKQRDDLRKVVKIVLEFLKLTPKGPQPPADILQALSSIIEVTAPDPQDCHYAMCETMTSALRKYLPGMPAVHVEQTPPLPNEPSRN